MYLCYKCNSRMVEVELVNLRGQIQRAIVCTYCGRLYSKDRAFQKRKKAG